MIIAKNYTSLKTRESRIYSVSGTKVSATGISVTFIKIFGSALIFFNIIGAIICLANGEFYYWPLTADLNFNPTFAIIFIGVPFGISFGLQYLKVQNYTLLEFLFAYFKPKQTIDQNGKVIKNMSYNQDAIIENL